VKRHLLFRNQILFLPSQIFLKVEFMYSIVEIAGQQFKVEAGNEIFVHHLNGNVGDKVEFNTILLTDNDGKVEVGAPYVKGTVTASIVNQLVKGDKVIVFKKKRRKGYRVKNGHRQSFTKILIDKVK
jgi:large subunit ribosomal protein L21